MSFLTKLMNVKYEKKLNIKNFSKKDINYNIVNENNIQNYSIESYETSLEAFPTFNYENIFEDDYTAQGLTIIDNKAYISAYKSGDNQSRLYVYDLTKKEYNTFCGIIELDQGTHVGGIAYDKENDILYVTNGSGKFTTYKYSRILSLIEEQSENKTFTVNLKTINNINKDDFLNTLYEHNDDPVIKAALETDNDKLYENWKNLKEYPDNETYKKIIYYLNETYGAAIYNNINAKCTASTTYFYDGLLYVGKFNGIQQGKLDILKPTIVVDEYGTEHIEYERLYNDTLSCPSAVQGVAVTKYKGEEYILFSRSIAFADSSIVVYKKNPDGSYTDLGVKYFSGDVGLEGIQINESGQVIGVCEEIFHNSQESVVYSLDNILNTLTDYDIYIELQYKLYGSAWSNDASDVKKMATKILDKLKDKSENIPAENKLASALIDTGALIVFLPVTGFKILRDFYLPKFIRKNELVSDLSDDTDTYLSERFIEPLQTLSDEVYEDGLVIGGAKGYAKASAGIVTSKAKFLLNSGLSVGKSIDKLVNPFLKELGYEEIDLNDFDKLKEATSEAMDVLKEDLYDSVDYLTDESCEKVAEAVEISDEFMTTFKENSKKNGKFNEIKDFTGCVVDTVKDYYWNPAKNYTEKVVSETTEISDEFFSTLAENVNQNGVGAEVKSFGGCVVDTVEDYWESSKNAILNGKYSPFKYF